MNLKIEDHITHINNEEDIPYLRSKLLDVNIRLFKSSKHYRSLVIDACNYIKWLCSETMEGYKKPHGMSGANAGVPWNIIAITRNRGKDDEWYQIMINPRIIKYDGEIISTESNCGSIRLEKPIKVKKHSVIFMEYYTEKGDKMDTGFARHEGAFTIQHEIDHNLGVLITDKGRIWI